MRLVCPNCAATYEVPEDAIPDSGRDVQCASCGHAWFFQRGTSEMAATPVVEPAAEAQDMPAAETIVPDVPLPDLPADELASGDDTLTAEAEATPATALAETEAEAEVALAKALDADTAKAGDEPSATDTPDAALPEDAVQPLEPTQTEAVDEDPGAAIAESAASPSDDASLSGDEDFDGDEEDLDGFALPAAVTSLVADGASPGKSGGYRTDDSVLAILREEAEREAMVRWGDPVPLETQPDLGVDAAMPDRLTAPAVTATADAGAEPTFAGDDTTRPPARRDLLPDVEEINSTLRPTEGANTAEAMGDPALTAADRKDGFRSGFLMVMVVSIIGAGVYALAPQISAAVPSLTDPLQSYISGVDALRLALDGVMRSATVALNGG